MIDRKKVVAIASQNLMGMRMYPDTKTDEGKAVMGAIVTRLQEHATDENHVHRATSKLRDSGDFFPTPHAIVDACEETREASTEVATLDCDHCRGTGWEVVERNGIEGLKRCRCGKIPPPSSTMTVKIGGAQ